MGRVNGGGKRGDAADEAVPPGHETESAQGGREIIPQSNEAPAKDENDDD